MDMILNMNSREISEDLGMNISSVKVIVKRLKDRLKVFDFRR